MLTSKQRAYLRGLAADMETIIMIGKEGMSDAIVTSAREAITARELIKGKVLVETSPISPRDAAEYIADCIGCEVVQVIGSKFVLYKRHPKEPKIVLPRAKK
ncbi:MAG: YhbY family RNA-binding protein [Ruminococcaceae bacterium]|nr:YhbY family RNA-binding protein [Oscillospiraceae bacterium]